MDKYEQSMHRGRVGEHDRLKKRVAADLHKIKDSLAQLDIVPDKEFIENVSRRELFRRDLALAVMLLLDGRRGEVSSEDVEALSSVAGSRHGDDTHSEIRQAEV